MVFVLIVKFYTRAREALSCYTARVDLTLSILSRSVSMRKCYYACDEVKLSDSAADFFVCINNKDYDDEEDKGYDEEYDA